MIRTLRRRLDRLELAREPGHSTGDYLAEVLEEFCATADPDACQRALELIDEVAAERGDAEITAVEATAAECAPPLQPPDLPAAGPGSTVTLQTEAADQPMRDPPKPEPSQPESLPAYLQWQLVINKPPPGPRPPPPRPYRDPLDDPLGLYE